MRKNTQKLGAIPLKSRAAPFLRHGGRSTTSGTLDKKKVISKYVYYLLPAKHTLLSTIVAYSVGVVFNDQHFHLDVNYFHENIFQLTLAATIASLIGTVFVYIKV